MRFRPNLKFGRKATAVALADEPDILEPRKGERQATELQVTARLSVGDPVPITIEELSTSGFRAAIPLELSEGTLLRIGLPGGRSPHARVVHSEGGKVACAFLAPLDEAEVSMLAGVSAAE